MGMGLRRRGGVGRRHRRVGIGRRKRRFGRRRRGRGGGLGSLIFLCCMGGARRDVRYGQDVQQLQQQQMMLLQALQQQQLGVLLQQQQQMSQQQQPFAQQAVGQPPQYDAAVQGAPAGQGLYPACNDEQIKDLQSEQVELLKEIMKKQEEEKDPKELQELFNQQNTLLAQMNQLQSAGYAYPEPLPAPAVAEPAQSQETPMQT